MSGNPFDREVWNLRERPLSTDNNLGQTMLDRALRHFALNLFSIRSGSGGNSGFLSTPVVSGFVGDGFFVQAGVAVQQVIVTAGIGFINDPSDVPFSIGGVTGVDDQETYKPQVLLSPMTITGIPAPNAVNPRIDIVEVRTNRRLIDPTNRDILDPGTGKFLATPGENKTLTFSQDGQFGVVTTPTPSTAGVGYIAGTPAGAPVAPPTTPGYVKIADVHIPASGAPIMITQGTMRDSRKILCPNGTGHAHASFSQNIGVPTFSSLISYPSVRAAVRYSSNTAGTFYLIAGDLIQDAVFTATVATINASPNQVRGIQLFGTSIMAATGVEVADLAAATPAIVIPVGQEVIKVPFVQTATNDPVTSSFVDLDVWWR
jgi:hypothetical protein